MLLQFIVHTLENVDLLNAIKKNDETLDSRKPILLFFNRYANIYFLRTVGSEGGNIL